MLVVGSVALTVVIGYLCGCFNGAIIISKYVLKNDIRQHGSGNAGLTNFHRVFGGKLTFAVIAFDVIKAVVGVLVGAALLGCVVNAPLLGKYVGGISVLLGHCFPFMFGFKGGKGILSGGTVALMVDLRVGLLVLGLFAVIVALTRYVSLGSIAAGIAFPFASWYFLGRFYLIFGAALGALVVFMHRGNISRLLKGEENKLSFKKKNKG